MDFEQISAAAKAACQSTDRTSGAAEGALDGERRIALRNRGVIDPQSIEQYVISGGGYRGLDGALKAGAGAVIDRLRQAGLRDRAGEGDITADRLQRFRDLPGDGKLIVCNGIDAEPDGPTATILFHTDPYSVLEGLLVAAYAAGADRAFIVVDEDGVTSLLNVTTALERMGKYGLTGKGILESGFSLDIGVKAFPGGPVYGEATALLRALDGQQALPYVKGSRPDTVGGVPAIVFDAETLAVIPAFIFHDTEITNDPGTRIITVTDDAETAVTVEIPLGTTLRELLRIAEMERDVYAVQYPGRGGSFFSGEGLDAPITCEMTGEAGALNGAGSLRVYRAKTCAVAMAKEAIDYLAAASCGQCVFCREGTYQMADILQDIIGGKADADDLIMLQNLGELMKQGCICDIGSTASMPVLSVLRLFRDDFEKHVNGKGCTVA